MQSSLQDLQEQNRQDQQEIYTLQRMNNELETARNRFIKLYDEAKDERRELRTKLDDLQDKYYTDMNTSMKKYHLALAVTAVCVLLLLILNAQNVISLVQTGR